MESEAELNEAVVRLAAKMLKAYARDLGNQGCNDFDLGEQGVPEHLWVEFVRLAEEDNRSPQEYVPGLPSSEYRRHLPDFQVAHWLSRRLSGMAK